MRAVKGSGHRALFADVSARARVRLLGHVRWLSVIQVSVQVEILSVAFQQVVGRSLDKSGSVFEAAGPLGAMKQREERNLHIHDNFCYVTKVTMEI
jgi:hypothetical protein